MWKSLAAIITAAVIAGAFTGFPQLVEPVSATPVVAMPVSATPAVATPSAAVKPIKAPACPELAWPYNQCGASKVRLITTDRLN